MENRQLKIKDKVAEEKRRWVRLTKVCNNNCLFCLDKDNQDDKIISFKQIIQDLKRGRKEGAKRVVLSGGEPTLHPQILEIIKEVRKLGYNHIQMISNGRMLAYDDFVKKLKEAGLDEITFSLHSHLKNKFEQITQIKDSYNQSIKGLLNTLKNNFIVSVDIVINKINYKTLKDTLNFFIKLGVSEFDLLWLVPFGSAWENRAKLFINPPLKSKNYLDAAFELAQNNKNLFIWTNRMPAVYLEGHEDLIQNPVKMIDEVKGTEFNLKRYIQNDGPMSCFGKRCNYCFMENFCKDLMELKEKKLLKSKSYPRCIKNSGSKNYLVKKRIFKFTKNLDLYKFLDFYIKNRYFVKSIRCKKCKYYAVCDGAQINMIRNKGFKILNPIH